MTKKVNRYKINATIVARITEAYEAATMESCGLDDETKRKMRPYVASWIEAPLRQALREIKRQEL